MRRPPDQDRGSPHDRSPPVTFGRRRFVALLSGSTASLALGPAVLAACGSEPVPGGGPGPGDAGPDAAPSPAPGTPDASDSDAGPAPEARPYPGWGRVALIHTRDREAGVREAVRGLGLPLPTGRVALKPNFNTGRPAPASTHPTVLATLVGLLREAGATVTVAERSGSADTAEVVREVGLDSLAGEAGFTWTTLDDLDRRGWRLVRPAESHWEDGFPMARVFLEADAVVQACCLKTHAYGGHFTLSLKNSVGMVARVLPGATHDFMMELHDSPRQRSMIAEINTAYQPALVVLDAVEGFATGGPDDGDLITPEVMLAAADRVALDAVGVALLRHHGTTPEVSAGSIFSQEQIARAAELGLGATGPEEIELVTADARGDALARTLRDRLADT